MKRILPLVLACALMFSLAACGGESAGPDNSGAESPVPESGGPVQSDTQTPENAQPDSSMAELSQPDEPAVQEGGETPAKPAPSTEPASSEPAQSGETDRPIKPDLPGPLRSQKADIEALWEKLYGCWTATDERFAYFTYQDGAPAFIGGVWESEAAFRRGSGLVTKLIPHSDREYTVTVTYPSVEDGNAADEQETREMVWSFELDVGREGIDETIRLNDFDGVTRQYAWGGYSYDNAYDSTHPGNYASFEEMQALWTRLAGYWNGEDGRFVAFDQMDSNTLVFCGGLWESGGGRGWGNFEKGMSAIDEAPLKFIIVYPAVENEMDGVLPELSLPVWLDITDLDTDKVLRVKLGEDGQWAAYAWAGETEEEARQSIW